MIKVEAPTRFDGTRAYPRFVSDRRNRLVASESEHNYRTQFEQLHRGQRGITLDLRSAPGARAFRELVAASDVVIANFAAGVIERLGIGWSRLRQVNPRLVLVSMPSFGDDGPERDYLAYGVSQEELAGLYALTGYAGESPLKTGSNVGDPMNGMHAALAVAAALTERERTGLGQYVELSQLESSLQFVGETILEYGLNGQVRGPAGNAHPRWAPLGIYATVGSDQWIAIAGQDEEQWQVLTGILELGTPTADPRFADEASRHRHRASLDQAIGEATRQHKRFVLAAELQSRGVAAAPVLNSDDVQHHPWFSESGYVQAHAHPAGGEYRYFGPLWRIDGRRPRLRGPAPLLAEHSTRSSPSSPRSVPTRLPSKSPGRRLATEPTAAHPWEHQRPAEWEMRKR